MPDELKAALKAELADDPTGRGYAEKTPNEIVHLLTSEYEIANPEPQGTVPITEWAPDELKNMLLQATVGGVPVWLAIQSLQTNENQELAALAKLIPEVFTLKAVNLENPLVLGAIDTLRTVGVIPQELYDAITLKPDPLYQPIITQPCRVDASLGGYIPDPSEIAEAEAVV